LRPILYVENDIRDPQQSANLLTKIRSFGYRIWQHNPLLFNDCNFNSSAENVFGNVASINVLAIHREMANLYSDITGFLSPIVPTSPNIS
jgi:hypothetical protein